MKTTFLVIYTILVLITYVFILVRLRVLDNKHFEHLKCDKLKKSNKFVIKWIFVIMLAQYVFSLFIILTLL